jgi:hypothetical protein
MPLQKIEIELDVPAGYQLTGEYRKPQAGEKVYDIQTGQVYTELFNPGLDPAFIVIPTKLYREPVLPADYGKVAEFSDDGHRWVVGELIGWTGPKRELGTRWHELHNRWNLARIEVTDDKR